NLRQCWIITGGDFLRRAKRFRVKETRQTRNNERYQLFLKPAEMLLLVVLVAVSPTEPEMVTPSYSFCSAPNFRSHLSSVVVSDWPATKLVPVSVMLSFADWSV